MCTRRPQRHGLHCIVPPYMLSNIVANGSDTQSRAALRNLLIDPTWRLMRASAPAGAIARLLADATDAPPVGPMRTIRDARNGMEVPGPVVRRHEGDAPTGDAAVDEAYEGLGATFDLFWQAYQRNSIDGAGLPLDATVHYERDYDNAFWDGAQMVFGDGDGALFQRFTIAVDVIGHELTHGVTEKESGLVYFAQSGALNESISDVFGSLVKQRALGQTAEQADWLIGAGLFTPAVKGVALRSMAAPGTAYDDPVLGRDPQPAHMDQFVTTNEDNGGVHINSGIPNRAFVLAARAIGGPAWETAGRIWYHALLDPATWEETDFAGFAGVTLATVDRLHGTGSAESAAVAEAWRTVGVVP